MQLHNKHTSWDNAVDTVIMLRIGWSGVRFLGQQEIFPFSLNVQTNCRAQLIYSIVSGVLSLGVKRPECEANHSPPSIAMLKNEGSYTTTPLTYPRSVQRNNAPNNVHP